MLEVTEPRTPCANFARRMGETQWVKRFAAEGRIGTYLRVISRGAITAGDTVVVDAQPEHGITVAQVFAGLSGGDAQRLLDWEAGGGVLGADLHKAIAGALRSAV